MSGYRWDTPHDWLYEKIWDEIDGIEGERVSKPARRLASYTIAIIEALSSDELQAIFQSEMDADGYFDPIEED